jgi:hypothetical protein
LNFQPHFQSSFSFSGHSADLMHFSSLDKQQTERVYSNTYLKQCDKNSDNIKPQGKNVE